MYFTMDVSGCLHNVMSYLQGAYHCVQDTNTMVSDPCVEFLICRTKGEWGGELIPLLTRTLGLLCGRNLLWGGGGGRGRLTPTM